MRYFIVTVCVRFGAPFNSSVFSMHAIQSDKFPAVGLNLTQRIKEQLQVDERDEMQIVSIYPVSYEDIKDAGLTWIEIAPN